MRTYITMAELEARDPEWAARVRDRDRRKTQRLRAANPEHARALGRENYASKRDHYVAKKAAWRAANPEKPTAAKKKYKKQNRAKYVVQHIRGQARRKRVPFDLTVEWVQQRLSAGACELSGLPFDMETVHGRNSPTIDRRVAGGPYTQDNCRMVLWSINRALNNWGEDYLCHIFKHVIARRGG